MSNKEGVDNESVLHLHGCCLSGLGCSGCIPSYGNEDVVLFLMEKGDETDIAVDWSHGGVAACFGMRKRE